MSLRRILTVIETLGRGGAERLLLTQHRHLDPARFEGHVVALFEPTPLASELEEAGVLVTRLGLPGPLALPLASLTMVPPGGSGVVAEMPASSSARALANEAWPLAWLRFTGFSGDTRLSPWCRGTPSTLGVGTVSHFSWCQPRPSIHSPGFAVRAASATMETISSQVLACVRSRIIWARPRPV